MQQQVMDLLIKEEEVGWKTILYDLIKTEQMDPWDVNITLLTQKYIETIRAMQEHNLRISGKILLAAAFLLKLKSSHLLDHDITNLDRLINSTEEEIEDEDIFADMQDGTKIVKEKFKLIPRNPQPRDRKVAIQDLINALQKAMVSKRRILAKQRPVKFVMPKRGVDIMEVIRDVYHKIIYYHDRKGKKSMTFTELLPPQASKQAKAFTFIPLLHLENEKKVATSQKAHFEEINVKLLKKIKV